MKGSFMINYAYLVFILSRAKYVETITTLSLKLEVEDKSRGRVQDKA